MVSDINNRNLFSEKKRVSSLGRQIYINIEISSAFKKNWNLKTS